MNLNRFFSLVLLSTVCLTAAPGTWGQQVPVRNDTPRVGQQEIIMMRHAYLDEGSYDYWYEQSSLGVWPWFERLGSRILGDFEVIYPEGNDATPGQDEALRFARYASYEHWQATRQATGASSGDTGGSLGLAGNGGLEQGFRDGIDNRRQVQQGSRGGYFLQGHMAETRPLYMPGLEENYELIDGNPDPGTDAVIPVRLDRATDINEIMVLEYRQISKHQFEEFHAITRDGTYPYLEKIGVRPVGQWRVVYFPDSDAKESADYDEVFTLVRYASFAHYQAVRDNAVSMGGNGPDYAALLEALTKLNAMTQEVAMEFLQGPLFGSPPQFAPGMNERYRLVD